LIRSVPPPNASVRFLRRESASEAPFLQSVLAPTATAVFAAFRLPGRPPAIAGRNRGGLASERPGRYSLGSP